MLHRGAEFSAVRLHNVTILVHSHLLATQCNLFRVSASKRVNMNEDSTARKLAKLAAVCVICIGIVFGLAFLLQRLF